MRGIVELFKAEVITGFAPTPLLSWGPIYWARVLPFSDPDSRREQPTGASARKLTEEKWAAEALKDAWNSPGLRGQFCPGLEGAAGFLQAEILL